MAKPKGPRKVVRQGKGTFGPPIAPNTVPRRMGVPKK